MVNKNILSQRYASRELNDIWSERGKTLAERELWVAVMKAERELGVDIPAEDIAKYESAKEDIDLDRIEEIERVTRHDIKAKIQAFVEVAGAKEHIHRPLTSRDLTDNVEQMQIKKSAELVFGKNVSMLRHFCDKAEEYQDIVLTARTHHQAAQPTLLGRRMSMWGEELLFHLEGFENLIQRIPLRGIKGPVGTQFDMLTLLGSKEKVDELEKKVAGQLGFTRILNSPGQVYPRSLDYAMLSNLAFLSSASENFATTMRLMSGYELTTEGFKEGQVGSSAMPHKMNTRSSERICGFAKIIKGYVDMVSRLAGDQWEEGDVSCSVVRRVALPDSFYSADGLAETTLTVLNEMGAYPVMINKETDRYLPFLATTEILNEATQAGLGREEAHKIVKKYAIPVALAMRQGRENTLAYDLGNDSTFREVGITKERITGILADKKHFVGNAKEQIASVKGNAGRIINDYSEKAAYEPGDIL